MARRRSFMKKACTVSAIAVGTLAGCVGGGGGDGGGEEDGPITLRISAFITEDDPLYYAKVNAFKERLQELTDREVQFEEYPGGQIGGPDEMLSLLEGGTVDLSWVSFPYEGETFKLTQVAELPGYDYTPVELTRAFHEISQGILHENEFQNVGIKMIVPGVLPQFNVGTLDTQVTSFDDFNGLSLRTTGGLQNVTFNELGANPVSIPAPDLYSALDQGTVDGLVTHLPGMEAYNAHEVIQYLTTNGKFGTASTAFCMDLDQFNSYSNDFQNALVEAGLAGGVNVAETLTSEVEGVIDRFADAGVEAYEMPSEMNERFVSEVVPVVRDTWQEDHSDLGSQEVYDEFKSALESQ